MATSVTTIPSSDELNPSCLNTLHYDNILADACAFNRRLSKGRGQRPTFFDSATQITQRPAPWLHRTSQARVKRLPMSRPHLIMVYRRHRWLAQPQRHRITKSKRLEEDLEHSHVLFMFQTMQFPQSSNISSGIPSSTLKPQDPSSVRNTGLRTPSYPDFSKQTTAAPVGILNNIEDPDASLPGSLSGDGSSLSTNTQNSTSNTGPGILERHQQQLHNHYHYQKQQQQSTLQSYHQVSSEGGTTGDCTHQSEERRECAGTGAEDERSERYSLRQQTAYSNRVMSTGYHASSGGVGKLRLKMEKRKYHRRVPGEYGRLDFHRTRGRRGRGVHHEGNRWVSNNPSANPLPTFDETSLDSFAASDEVAYRSNASFTSNHPEELLHKSNLLDSPDLESEFAPLPLPPQQSHQSMRSYPVGPEITPPVTAVAAANQRENRPEFSAISEANSVDALRWKPSGTPVEGIHGGMIPKKNLPQSGSINTSICAGSMDNIAGSVSKDMNTSQCHAESRQFQPNQCPPLVGNHGYHPSSRSAQFGAPLQSDIPSQTYVNHKPQPQQPPSQQLSEGSSNQTVTSTSTVLNGSTASSEATTVVTFFVCEVCASRYRSTAGLRYHYHSQHAGYTPIHPISASASRVTIPMHEFNRFGPTTGLRGGRNSRSKRTRCGNNFSTNRGGMGSGYTGGRGLSKANQHQQQLNSQRSAVNDGNDTDPYHMSSANTPEDPNARSIYSCSSEVQQTEPVNSVSYKSKALSEMDYHNQQQLQRKAAHGPLPMHQYAPPHLDGSMKRTCGSQNYTASATSALASMDHMTSSLLHDQPPSLLSQLHPPSNHFSGSRDRGYPDHCQGNYSQMVSSMTQLHRSNYCGRLSFVELRSQIRQRRGQFPLPVDVFACGYCQMQLQPGDAESHSRCFNCGLPAHLTCILRFRTGVRRLANSQLLCYPWLCTECKTCWICGSGVNVEHFVCCAECDRGYHGYCLAASGPGYQSVNFPDDWVCEVCRQQTPQAPVACLTLPP